MGTPLSLLTGAPTFGGGAGSSLGNDQDQLTATARGDNSLSSPFTFGGSARTATPGGAVPAWLIAVGLVVFFAAMRRRP